MQTTVNHVKVVKCNKYKLIVVLNRLRHVILTIIVNERAIADSRHELAVKLF